MVHALPFRLLRDGGIALLHLCGYRQPYKPDMNLPITLKNVRFPFPAESLKSYMRADNTTGLYWPLKFASEQRVGGSSCVDMFAFAALSAFEGVKGVVTLRYMPPTASLVLAMRKRPCVLLPQHAACKRWRWLWQTPVSWRSDYALMYWETIARVLGSGTVCYS